MIGYAVMNGQGAVSDAEAKLYGAKIVGDPTDYFMNQSDAVIGANIDSAQRQYVDMMRTNSSTYDGGVYFDDRAKVKGPGGQIYEGTWTHKNPDVEGHKPDGKIHVPGGEDIKALNPEEAEQIYRDGKDAVALILTKNGVPEAEARATAEAMDLATIQALANGPGDDLRSTRQYLEAKEKYPDAFERIEDADQFSHGSVKAVWTSAPDRRSREAKREADRKQGAE
jgi:hypothetical protein